MPDSVDEFALNHIKLFASVGRIFLAWAALAAIAAAACGAADRRPPARSTVRVAAASDLNAAMGDAIARFSAAHAVDVSVSYGSSGTLYAQLLNLAPALQFAETGAADAAIVARSLVSAPAVQNRGRWLDIPAEAHPRLEQRGVVLENASDPQAARAFRDFILGGDGRAILEQYGF